jgi:hypothetical protein
MLDLVEAAETALFITMQEFYANRSCSECIQYMLYEIQNHTSLQHKIVYKCNSNEDKSSTTLLAEMYSPRQHVLITSPASTASRGGYWPCW